MSNPARLARKGLICGRSSRRPSLRARLGEHDGGLGRRALRAPQAEGGGTGKPLFAEGTRPGRWKVVKSRVGDAGVIIATYELVGELVTGTIGV